MSRYGHCGNQLFTDRIKELMQRIAATKETKLCSMKIPLTDDDISSKNTLYSLKGRNPPNQIVASQVISLAQDCTCAYKSTRVPNANTRNKLPPMYCTSFSDMYFERKDPPSTAIIVATAWPDTAPIQTPTGDEAAESAAVARKDLSPHSAANTRPNVESIRLPEPEEHKPMSTLLFHKLAIYHSKGTILLLSCKFQTCRQSRNNFLRFVLLLHSSVIGIFCCLFSNNPDIRIKVRNSTFLKPML